MLLDNFSLPCVMLAIDFFTKGNSTSMHAFMWHSCIKTTCLSWWCLVFDRHFQETHYYWCDEETENEWLILQYNNLLWERDSDSSCFTSCMLAINTCWPCSQSPNQLPSYRALQPVTQPQDFSSLHSSNLNRNAAQSELSHLHPKPHATLYSSLVHRYEAIIP